MIDLEMGKNYKHKDSGVVIKITCILENTYFYDAIIGLNNYTISLSRWFERYSGFHSELEESKIYNSFLWKALNEE